ncbi:dihydrolipoamide acetyltransferase family protein [Amnibacterium kyonggiense]|uniref:Dihydrolipoamide acetyltransferase component of pyruvate dehydrogenase complex n=1 Tax=Amnibacterium kyonggiense TaxID=595671 RepID=A0A4R7FQ15_9MICO|nr:dihydrolipoamide acetyltransferase family protein [Amnibacterium kyonggiense]TDS79862.1 pyruvate dehydrogenase E2 component (dihydrolipoamide acetyltransferase) [Amnibacterium kyonggiense]
MTTSHFALPDVGEGLTEAEIVSWKVAPGDEVTVNQVIVEIETAKSLVELPSPYAGTVAELLVAEGDTVAVGTPIVAVASGTAEQLAAPLRTPAQAASPVEVQVREPAEQVDEGSGSVLVGYGTDTHAKSRRGQRRGPVASPVPVRTPVAAPVKPPIRKLAKDLGVDLGRVAPSGTSGEVTRDDVLRAKQQESVFRNVETPAWPDSREERVPVKGMRKAIANAMVSSAFTAPHVSVFVDVDATRTMEYIKRLKASPDFANVRISPLLVMARAVIWAVRRNPTVNSSWTDSEIVVHHYVNLGIAAATPRGLIVPNVKDAQSLSMRNLASSLEQLVITARDGKTQPAEMAQGTITITNLGSFGMDTGTPILNPGEVAIVALGTIKQKPWVVDGEVVPRYVTTIGASFDHRVVDGDVASRFTADVAAILEEPALLLD